MAIKFGTSGWRAIISEEFTFANVRLLSQAVANYLKKIRFGKKEGLSLDTIVDFYHLNLLRKPQELLHLII